MYRLRTCFANLAIVLFVSGTLIAPLMHEVQHALVEQQALQAFAEAPVHIHQEYPAVGEECPTLPEIKSTCIQCLLASDWAVEIDQQAGTTGLPSVLKGLSERLVLQRNLALQLIRGPPTAPIA